MEVNIKEQTIVELKAMCLDLRDEKDRIDSNLKVIYNEIGLKIAVKSAIREEKVLERLASKVSNTVQAGENPDKKEKT